MRWALPRTGHLIEPQGSGVAVGLHSNCLTLSPPSPCVCHTAPAPPADPVSGAAGLLAAAGGRLPARPLPLGARRPPALLIFPSGGGQGAGAVPPGTRGRAAVRQRYRRTSACGCRVFLRAWGLIRVAESKCGEASPAPRASPPRSPPRRALPGVHSGGSAQARGAAGAGVPAAGRAAVGGAIPG